MKTYKINKSFCDNCNKGDIINPVKPYDVLCMCDKYRTMDCEKVKKAKPISYTTENVSKILKDIKTHTRRVIIPPFEIHANGYITRKRGKNRLYPYQCPYGKARDILWVQESYQITVFDREDESFEISGYYWADKQSFKEIALEKDEWEKLCNRKYPENFTPGRFMYRSLSRIFLEIKSIKIEKIQDISEQDCIREGIQIPISVDCRPLLKLTGKYPQSKYYKKYGLIKAYFASLWNDINAKRGYTWENNPWVWVIEFEKHLKDKLIYEASKTNTT